MEDQSMWGKAMDFLSGRKALKKAEATGVPKPTPTPPVQTTDYIKAEIARQKKPKDPVEEALATPPAKRKTPLRDALKKQ